MAINFDIDIDFAFREKLLELIEHVPAGIRTDEDSIRKHPSGIYVTDIPYDPVHDIATIDYLEAEKRGYIKLDLLNVFVYEQVKNEAHLVKLMQEPDWNMLNDSGTVRRLIHLSNHYYSMREMAEPIDSIPRLAMFLALIRPAKKHMIGLSWSEISKTIWDKDSDDGYSFKRSHAIAYAQLVVVHMNLIKEERKHRKER